MTRRSDLTDPTEQKILDFLERRGSAFEVEISASLGIPYAQVKRMLDDLVKKGFAIESDGASVAGSAMYSPNWQALASV